MSIQKLVFVTAVPFGLARLQSNASKTIVNMTSGIGVTQSTDNNNVRILPQFRTTVQKTTNPRLIKKRNKMLPNRITARISREKIKHQKDLLEQQLLDVKVEKMKLLLENEDLKMRCNTLEEENNSLRMQLPNASFGNESSLMSERTFKYAEGLGSSTDFHHSDDSFGGIIQQLPTETNYCIPSLEHLSDFQQNVETTGTSDCIIETDDVFVCPLSQDIMKQPSNIGMNTIAQTLSHEEVVYCDVEMNVSEEKVNESSYINFPEPWTFENLYEELVDETNFYF